MREKSTEMTEGVRVALQNHPESVVGAGSSCFLFLSSHVEEPDAIAALSPKQHSY